MKTLQLIAALATLLLFSCSRSPIKSQELNLDAGYIKIEGNAQGTSYHITYQDVLDKNLQPQLDSLLTAFNKSFSIYDSSSLISKINRNESAVPNRWFREVFFIAERVHKASQGSFDITVGPLVNAFGFGNKPKDSISQHLIDSLLAFVGMEKVSLTPQGLVKADPRVQLDCNALAQGYSVDLVCNYFDSLQIPNYLVEIGGELRVKGRNPQGNLWQIGIDRPIEGSNEFVRQIQAIVQLDNQAIATSGNYRKFYVENGVKYAHSIDPKTGYPVRHNLLSVSILSDKAVTADAYATACMVSGLEKARQMVKNQAGLEAYFIYVDQDGQYQEEATAGFRQQISSGR